MSGAGDTNGEVSRDEAAWRELVARFELPADPAQTRAPWPASEDLASPPVARVDPDGPLSPAAETGGPGRADDGDDDTAANPVITPPASRPWARPGGSQGPADRTRVIRAAGDPRSYTPAEEDDERYVPAPLPPPAKLDSITKAALVGVIGGPGYLLVVSVFLHWTISAIAAFVAVAAFIGGFVTLVVKLGDRPRRDDDDDGAVL